MHEHSNITQKKSEMHVQNYSVGNVLLANIMQYWYSWKPRITNLHTHLFIIYLVPIVNKTSCIFTRFSFLRTSINSLTSIKTFDSSIFHWIKNLQQYFQKVTLKFECLEHRWDKRIDIKRNCMEKYNTFYQNIIGQS